MEAVAEQGSSLLDSISAFCRASGIAESTFGRRAVNDGKFVARLRDGARITPETLDRVTGFLERHGASAPATPPELRRLIRVAAPAGAASGTTARCALPQFPFLRQPAEVPAVRQHLRREGKGGAARRHGTRAHPPAPAGDPRVRRRHGRRHRADARDARNAPALPDAAVLLRRQGDQPRGRAAVARQDARPLLRASGDRHGGHQHVLHGGAVARTEVGQRRHLAGLARSRPHRHHRA